MQPCNIGDLLRGAAQKGSQDYPGVCLRKESPKIQAKIPIKTDGTEYVLSGDNGDSHYKVVINGRGVVHVVLELGREHTIRPDLEYHDAQSLGVVDMDTKQVVGPIRKLYQKYWFSMLCPSSFNRDAIVQHDNGDGTVFDAVYHSMDRTKTVYRARNEGLLDIGRPARNTAPFGPWDDTGQKAVYDPCKTVKATVKNRLMIVIPLACSEAFKRIVGTVREMHGLGQYDGDIVKRDLSHFAVVLLERFDVPICYQTVNGLLVSAGEKARTKHGVYNDLNEGGFRASSTISGLGTAIYSRSS